MWITQIFFRIRLSLFSFLHSTSLEHYGTNSVQIFFIKHSASYFSTKCCLFVKMYFPIKFQFITFFILLPTSCIFTDFSFEIDVRFMWMLHIHFNNLYYFCLSHSCYIDKVTNNLTDLHKIYAWKTIQLTEHILDLDVNFPFIFSSP